MNSQSRIRTALSGLTFFFTLDEKIETVTDQLLTGFGLGDEGFDGENVWEWWEADNKYYVFNLSRKHSGGERCVYHLKVKSDTLDFDDVEQNKLGEKLARVLGVDVHRGHPANKKAETTWFTRPGRFTRAPTDLPDRAK